MVVVAEKKVFENLQFTLYSGIQRLVTPALKSIIDHSLNLLNSNHLFAHNTYNLNRINCTLYTSNVFYTLSDMKKRHSFQSIKISALN